MHLRHVLLATLCLAAVSARADLRLPAFFSDHMVFQRDAPIPVWGWAEPGSEVVAQLGADVAKAVKVYGSMQVHQTAAKETVFAVNQWSGGPTANLGIGNSTADPKSKDWTFVSNAASFESARLRVFVRKKK